MARETVAQLRARIAELESENATLAADHVGQAAAPPAATAPRRSRGGTGRSVLAGVLIVVGVLITPVALVVQFATQQLTNTETFVATYAPLAKSPVVQTAVTNAVAGAIEQNIDLEGITGGLLDGLTQQLQLPSFVDNGIGLLKGSIVEGVKGLITWAVNGVVTSEWFPGLWEQSLRLTHTQLNAILRGDPGAVASLDNDTITLQLAPVIATVKSQLLDAGITIASVIPDDANVSIPIANVSGISQIKTVYATSVALGVWLPIVAAVLLVLGIAVAVRRRGWVIGAGISIAAIMLILGLGLAFGREVVTSLGVLNADALGLVFDTATGALTGSIIAGGILALLAALIAWISGPGRAASAVRRVLAFLPARLREALDRAGARRGAFGAFLERHRHLLYWIAAAIVVLLLVLLRPLTVLTVVLTIVGAIVVLFAIEALRSGTPAASATESVSGDEGLTDLPA